MYKQIIKQEKDFNLFYFYPDQNQVYITVSLKDTRVDLSDTVSVIYQKIVNLLQKNEMQIFREQIFGDNVFHREITKAREIVFQQGGINDPSLSSYIHGMPCFDTGLAGLQIQAVAFNPEEDQFWTVDDHGIPRGRGWKRNNVTYLMLQNIQGLSQHEGNGNSNPDQAARMFDYAEEILRGQGFQYLDVIRTWIYLANILDWYHDFNTVRNAKYSKYGFDMNNTSHMHKVHLPASTGIGGFNPVGAASTMDVLMISPHSGGHIEIEPLTGSEQNPPFCYGSAFSRGMSIRESGSKIIHASGTASIDENGNSAYIKDTRGQILRTLDVLDALISCEGATLQDICQATVFLKNSEDMDIYRKVMEETGLEKIPAVCVEADVCRDELLFELDAIIGINQV